MGCLLTLKRGNTSCEICRKGTYRVEGQDLKCSACLDGATCGANTTLQTAALHEGRWRLSSASRELSRCRYSKTEATATAFTPCAGGNDAGMRGQGYCVPGHHGPLCEVCDAPAGEQYFEEREARGTEGPNTSSRIGALAAIACGVSIGLLGLFYALHKVDWGSSTATRAARDLWLHVADTAHDLVLIPKFKLFVAFFQVVFSVPEIYNVKLPEEYNEWMVAPRPSNLASLHLQSA